MNDHLISRNKFLDALVLDADNKTDLIQVHQALEKAVISPDEVRGVGEWIDSADFAQCSVCKGTHLKEVNTIYGKTIWIRTPYCPNCGARMRMEVQDGTTD